MGLDEELRRACERILAEIARDRGCRVADLDPSLGTFVSFELARVALDVDRRVTARLLEAHGIGERDTPLVPEGYELELAREQGRLPKGVR